MKKKREMQQLLMFSLMCGTWVKPQLATLFLYIAYTVSVKNCLSKALSELISVSFMVTFLNREGTTSLCTNANGSEKCL